MKGFIYLLEISITAIMLTVVLFVFLGTDVKLSWGRPDLVEYSRSPMSFLENPANVRDILNNNFTSLDKIILPEVDYGIRFVGTPKTNITVGCIPDQCNYVKSLLTPAYVNGRWINFTTAIFDPQFRVINSFSPNSNDAKAFYGTVTSRRNPSFATTPFTSGDYSNVQTSNDIYKDTSISGGGSLSAYQRYTLNLSNIDINSIIQIRYYYEGNYHASCTSLSNEEGSVQHKEGATWKIDDNLIQDMDTTVIVDFTSNFQSIVQNGLFEFGVEATALGTGACNAGISTDYVRFEVTLIDNTILTYDALVFVNYTDYATNKNTILDYLNKGGVIVGINSTVDNNDPDFNQIFNLTPVSAPSSPYGKITDYDMAKEEIPKYFLGLGFDVELKLDGFYHGTWYVWESPLQVTTPTPTSTRIENLSNGQGVTVGEGNLFNLTSPDGLNMWFKIKKIWQLSRVDIQPLNLTFTFLDFSEKNVDGTRVVAHPNRNYALMTTNNSAIWISDFPQSDEYRTLVKAAIASRVTDWVLIESVRDRETFSTSNFVSACCDMPEIIEFILTLWYRI